MDPPSKTSIDTELWNLVEQRAEEIIHCIQPNTVADTKREEILGFLQNLINKNCGSEIFPFGSMPLRVYLPDGDIDITSLTPKSREEDLAKLLVTLLNGPQRRGVVVCDVQYIRAQVAIVKCTINDIAVDISFNQLAGLSTLCFLEKVDFLIGKNHLFKRSVLLIKAWCYYESRIIGAQQGLLSTYGLELLVLCVINLFHSTLHGPLAVLHKFWEYYSKFDWENYAVSLNGPVPTRFLSGSVEKAGSDGEQLLISKEFLQTCSEKFTVSDGAPDNGAKVFPIKFLNIVDPLKEYNNLGRSVTQGNFYRIKSALNLGLRKFKEIIQHPGVTMGQRVENLFRSTLERNGRGQRPDVEVPISAFGTGKSEVSDLNGDLNKYYKWLLYSQQYHRNIEALSQPSTSPSPFYARDGIVMATPFQPQYQNAYHHRGNEVFVPRVPLCYLPATAGYSGEMQKSRGTCPFIPNVSQLTYRERHSGVAHASDVAHQPSKEAHLRAGSVYRGTRSGLRSPYKDEQFSTHQSNREMFSTLREQNSSAVTRSAAQKSRKGTGRIEVPLESKNNTIDLSLNEFPPLPSMEMPEKSSEASQSSLLDMDQAGQSSTHLGTIEFGTLRQAFSSEIPFPQMDKLAISGANTSCRGSSSNNQKKREGLNPKAKPFSSLKPSSSSTAADASLGVSKRGVPNTMEDLDPKAKPYTSLKPSSSSTAADASFGASKRGVPNNKGDLDPKAKPYSSLKPSSSSTAVDASFGVSKTGVPNTKDDLDPKAKPYTSLKPSSSSTAADASFEASKRGVPNTKEDLDPKAKPYTSLKPSSSSTAADASFGASKRGVPNNKGDLDPKAKPYSSLKPSSSSTAVDASFGVSKTGVPNTKDDLDPKAKPYTSLKPSSSSTAADASFEASKRGVPNTKEDLDPKAKPYSSLKPSSSSTAVDASSRASKRGVPNNKDDLDPKAKPYSSLKPSTSSTAAEASFGASKKGVPNTKEDLDRKAEPEPSRPWPLGNDKEFPPLSHK